MTPLEILQDLIRIDTQNPPGNERVAAGYVAALCAKSGLDHEVFTYGVDRSNVVVRLAPDRAERLVILGHLDVVRAEPGDWEYDPFAAEIHDGYLYGRGALDMKYFVAVALATLLELKPLEASLERGITCVFTADEENGSGFGLPRLLEEERIREELSGRTVLNEGGGFAYELGGRTWSLVETGQKGVCRLRLTVPELPDTNPYFPTLDHEAILARATRAVQGAAVPSHVPETARELLSGLTGTPVGGEREDLDRHLAQLSVHGDEFLAKLVYAMTHTMITPTILRGGSRNPELASGVKGQADFDCRLMPGVSRDAFLGAVRAALGELPVEVEVLSFSEGYETSFSNPILHTAEAALRRRDPQIAGCLPFITPGANDGRHLRPLGCDILGFAPLATSQPFKEVISLIHGINERISLESLDFCSSVMTDICRDYVRGAANHAD
jgi:acetylornithine deacetylase/succinyl-diaminopimelate desuccinylase-like protein